MRSLKKNKLHYLFLYLFIIYVALFFSSTIVSAEKNLRLQNENSSHLRNSENYIPEDISQNFSEALIEDQKNPNQEKLFRQKFKGKIIQRDSKNNNIPKTIIRIEAEPTQETPQKEAFAFLKENSQLLKIKVNNLNEGVLSQYGEFQHVFYKQRYQGIPVEGTRIAVHMKKNGRIIRLESDYQYELDDLIMDTNPTITMQEAISAVASELSIADSSSSITPEDEKSSVQEKYPPTSELVIYPDSKDCQFYLAWKVVYPSKSSWHYYIDAQNGEIIDKFDTAFYVLTDGIVTGQILPEDGEDPTDTVEREFPGSFVSSWYRETHQDCYWVYPPCYWVYPPCYYTNCFWCWWCWPPHEICERVCPPKEWYCPPREWHCDAPYYMWYNEDIEETNSWGEYCSLSFPSDYDLYRIRFGLDGSKCWVKNARNNAYFFEYEMSTPPNDLPHEWNNNLSNPLFNPDNPDSLFDSVNVFYHISDTLINYYNDDLNFDLGYTIDCYTNDHSERSKYGQTSMYWPDTRKIHFGDLWPKTSRDVDYIRHELQHAVTHKLYDFDYPSTPYPPEFEALNEALSFYFPCTQDGNPSFGSEWRNGEGIVYDISDPNITMKNWEENEAHHNGFIYAAALWDIRENRGSLSVLDIDKITLSHITFKPEIFLNAALDYYDTAYAYGCTSSQIRDMQYRFARRGINPGLLFETFDDGLLDGGWQGLDAYGQLQDEPSGLWHASNFHTYRGPYSLGYSKLKTGSNPPDYDYNTGSTTKGNAVLEIKHLDEFSSATISFWHWWETEEYGYYTFDKMKVYVSTDGGSSWGKKKEWSSCDANPPKAPDLWQKIIIPLDPDEELVSSLLLRFEFDSGDGVANGYDGWYIDDIEVEAAL